MNSLSWILYFADVLSKLGNLFGAFGGVLLFVSVICIIPGFLVVWQYSSDQFLQSKRTFARIALFGVPIGFTMLMISLFIPSKETMYMIAASEVGETVMTTNDGKEIYGELKATILDNIRQLRSEAAKEATGR